MSTLPELFRSNTNSAYFQPKKQGGIFTIKLKQNHNLQSVHHKFSQSRAATSYSNRTQKTNRHSVCFGQRPFSRQTVNSQMANYRSSKLSVALSETKPNVEEADSLKHTLNQQLIDMKINSQGMKSLKKDKQILQFQLSEMRAHILSECEEIQNAFGNRIRQLSSKLSEIRRQSGMQTKVNKEDIKQLSENLKIIDIVFEDIQCKIQSMHTQCIN